MKTKTRTQVKLKFNKNTVKLCIYALAGALFSLGEIISFAAPFAIALAAAVGSFGTALATVIGAAVTSFFAGRGEYQGLAVALVFLARMILGRWLAASPEKVSVREKREHNIPLWKRSLQHVRRYLTEAAELSFTESIFIRMALGSVASVVCGSAVCSIYGYANEALIGTVVMAVSCPVLVWLYSSAISVWDGPSEEAREVSLAAEGGKLALAVTVVLSLGSFGGFFDLSIPAAFFITLAVTKFRGALVGTLYGIVCGVVLTPILAPMFALAALASALLWKLSPAVAVTGACGAAALWSLYVLGISAMSDVVPKLVITSAAMAPLLSSSLLPEPKRGEGEMPHKSRENLASMMLRRENSRKMHTLAESMKDLSGVLYRLSDKLTSPETEEICTLCEGSFEEYCKNCGMRSACFGREESAMEELQARMTLTLKKEGRVGAGLIPSWLVKRCYSIGQIIDSVNAGYARMVSESKIYDRTGVVAADYEVMSEMLEESAECDCSEYDIDLELTRKAAAALRGRFNADTVAVFGKRIKKAVVRGVNVGGPTPPQNEIREIFSRACGFEFGDPEFELDGSQVIMKLQSTPAFSVKCGRASLAKSDAEGKSKRGDENSVTKIFSSGADRRGTGKTASEDCGDVISAFLTEDGRFFMLISDGMGSGRDAAVTSGICAVFIEKLLKAGAGMDTSLKMLNSMMRVRSGEVSATVDLMELDLMNGKTRFVKSGAAPSFVLRGGRLFRLQSKTVPIGIVRALDAEMIKFEIERGDIIVMLSDGVVKSFEDCPWLYDMLCDEKEWCDEPERMARKIVSRAVENGANDDITAGVVMVS